MFLIKHDIKTIFLSPTQNDNIDILSIIVNKIKKYISNYK
jgi:hypothetical protein